MIIQTISRSRTHNRPVAGQTIAEYGLLLAVVAAAVMGMQIYAKRGIQGVVKVAADQLSPFTDANGKALGREAQIAGMQYESGDRSHSVIASGDTVERVSETRAIVNRVINKGSAAGGIATTTIVNDTTVSRGNLTRNGVSDIASSTKTVTEVK